MIRWDEKSTSLKQLGNVDDFSLDGLGIVVSDALPHGIEVGMTYGEGELSGTVRHCTQRPDGSYFVGIEFDEASRNSILHFQPELLTRLQ